MFQTKSIICTRASYYCDRRKKLIFAPPEKFSRAGTGLNGVVQRRRSFSAVFSSDTSISKTEADFVTHQAKVFDEIAKEFPNKNLPPEIEQKLERIVGIVPQLKQNCRILDVGSGTGVLIPYFHSRGWKDILAVDLSKNMTLENQIEHGNKNMLGNDIGVQFWQGDATYLPTYYGPFECAFFNSCFGNFYDMCKTLLNVSLLIQDGGYIVISHPNGRQWQINLSNQYPNVVPHYLPDKKQIQDMISDLPLELLEYIEEPEFYCVVLKVPENYLMKGGPLYLEGEVIVGFGRGSKEMGVSTANIQPPKDLQVPLGVYFGWAQLQTEGDNQVHKMVMNIGQRPTIEDGQDITVEAHILHDYNRDFHGEYLKLVAIGFIRPEMKFESIEELVLRIKADVSLAKYKLDDLPEFTKNSFFT